MSSNSLQRIILIDTHLKGKEVELKVDKHTNINGTNAAGKTTLQRLIPVFYGAAPNAVIAKNNDKFVQWYLPRQSSYIIYEYLNAENQLCQVVLASKDGEIIQYRFISKGFERSDYIKKQYDNSIEYFNLQELKAQLNRNQINCSNLLNYTDYRIVIQNDRQSLNQNDKQNPLNKDLRHYINHYSLCQGRNNLRHIERLLTAIHNKSGKMTEIKAMIAAILKADGLDTPTITLKLSDVEKWAKESKAIEQLNYYQPKMSALWQLKTDLVLQEQQLTQDYRYLDDSLTTLAIQLNSLKDELTVKSNNGQNLFNDWMRLNADLTNKQAKLNAEKRQAQTHLDDIEQQLTSYINSDIESVIRDLENLVNWQETLKRLNTQHRFLIQESQDIKRKYDALKNNVRQSKSTLIEHENKQKSLQEKQRLALLAQQQQENTEIENTYRNEVEQLKDTHAQQKQTIAIELSELKMQLTHCSFNEEETEQQQSIEQRLQQAINNKDIAQANKEAAFQTVVNLKNQQRDSEQEYNKATTALRLAQENQQVLHKRFYANDKRSLIGFLNTEKPDWRDTIGKIINLDLLERNDLKPDIIDESDNFFGLSLDLNVLPDPFENLIEQLNTADKYTKEMEVRQKQIENTLQGINKQLKKAEESYTLATHELDNNKHKIEQLNDEKTWQLQQHYRNVSDRKQQLKIDIESRQKHSADIESLHKNQLSQKSIDYQSYKLQIKASGTQAMAELNAALEAIEKRIQEIEQQTNHELSELEAQYQHELSGEGIDTHLIQQLEAAINDYKININRVNQRREEAENYKTFQRVDIKRRKPELIEQINQLNTKLLALEERIANEKIKFEQQREVINRDKKQLQDSINHYSQQKTDITEVINALKNSKINKATQVVILTEKISLDEYRRNTIERHQCLAKQRPLLIKQIEDIEKIFHQNGDNSLFITYNQEYERLRAQTQLQGNEDNYLKVEALHDTFELLPQMLEAIRRQGRNYGDSIKTYYNVLKNLHDSIVAQAAMITRHINDDLDLGVISDSSVSIKSKITQQEYWKNLEIFNGLHKNWLSNECINQPSTEYLTEIQEIARLLGQGQQEKLALIDLFEIALHFKDDGRSKTIKTDHEFHNSSSNGMTYLVLCKFLLAFTKLLRGNANTTIHWPIDELGTLHIDNIEKIFTACERNNIIIVGALPNPDLAILKLFVNRYWLDGQTKTLATVAQIKDNLADKIRALENTHD
ncbi:MAG: ATP-binding protein [Methylococcaceae bacterium]